MSRIVVLTPADAGNGFACCGVVQYRVSPGRVAEILEQSLAEAGSGVVILDERLLAEVGERSLQQLDRRWSGVLVILPAPGATAKEDSYGAALIRRAIGYQVKVRL